MTLEGPCVARIAWRSRPGTRAPAGRVFLTASVYELFLQGSISVRIRQLMHVGTQFRQRIFSSTNIKNKLADLYGN